MTLTGLVVIPWFIWGWLTFGNIMIATAPTIRGYQRGFSLFIWFVERLLSFMVTLIPHALLFKIFESVLYFNFDLTSIEALNPILYYYYHVLPGTLTTICLICFLIGLSWKRQPWVILMIICGFGGGILLQPGSTRHGLAPESMLPLTLIGLMIATQFIHRLDRGLQCLILLVLLFEFAISRGLHTLMLTFWVIPPDDPNLLLKMEQTLTFGRDIAGSQWPLWATFATVAYLALLLVGYRFNDLTTSK